MKLNVLVLGLLVASCAGCVIEKVVFVPIIRDDGCNRTSASSAARLVKAFGLDNGYFANANQFNRKNTSKESHAAKLEKPFGPFDSIVVTLSAEVPAVVDVSGTDRSAVTNKPPRLWLGAIELAHEYHDRASAERMLDDFAGILADLNRIFGCDLSMPKWPAAVEETASTYLTENGGRPKIFATYNLIDQRITIEAEESLYGKRGNEVVMLVPPKIKMRIQFGGVEGWEGDDVAAGEVEAVSLGASIANRLSFDKRGGGWYGIEHDRGKPRYEYNVDTQRLMALPQ